jgi:hypothetical protein
MKNKKEMLKKCLKCGSLEFEINEFIVHKAAMDGKDGDLTAYKVKNNGIEQIFCSSCGKEYVENDFVKINFY